MKIFFDSLESGFIWRTKPKDFNDPFDYYPSFDERKELLLSIEKIALDHIFKSVNSNTPKGARLQIPQLRTDLFYESFLDNFREKMKVACFTETNDEILMWSHYARSHTGICVEYDIQRNTELISHICPVFYVTKMLNITNYFARSIAQSVVLYYGTGNYDLNGHPININPWATTLVGLIKLSKWDYEKEWRLIYHKNDLPGAKFNMPVKAVYFGLNTSNENKQIILKMAQNKSFDVYEMERKRNDYSIQPRQIFSAQKRVFVSSV